ncbi:MAG: hypothetical protein VW035_10075, partial [Luminiphilus sp.]
RLFRRPRDYQLRFRFAWGLAEHQHLPIPLKGRMSRIDTIEIAADQKRVETVFVGGLKSLPVK